jgi:plastocyanin
MKGARALAGALLILALICAVPAVSAAQDAGTGDSTTTTSDPGAPPPDPIAPADSGSSSSSSPADNGTSKSGPRTDGGSSGAGGQDSSGSQSTDTSSASSGSRSRLAHVAQTTSVQMKDFLFSPATVTVHVGDLITWRNTGKAPHTATADDGSFDTGTVTPGQSASHMFTRPGTFTYYCTIHPNMKGTVRVLGASGSSGSASSSSTDPGSGSGLTESQAINSPNAAGDKNTLPMSGLDAGALVLAGLTMLAMGLLVRPLIAAEHEGGRGQLLDTQLATPRMSARDEGIALRERSGFKVASRNVTVPGLVVLAIFSGVALGLSPVLRHKLQRPR